MDAQAVLLDLLDGYAVGLRQALKDLPAPALVWQPDPEANHISATLWHSCRVMDTVKVLRMDNRPAADQLWFTGGWAARTGYDPRGLGARGMGNLIGYSVAEMLAVPVLPLADALAYFEACHGALAEAVRALPGDQLAATAPGGDPQRTYYEWTRICLLDGLAHRGEISALRAMWERQAASRGAG